jgi:hypothetical protein
MARNCPLLPGIAKIKNSAANLNGSPENTGCFSHVASTSQAATPARNLTTDRKVSGSTPEECATTCIADREGSAHYSGGLKATYSPKYPQ